ncbi:methyltransferase domain-containing protein [Mesorhizobium sp. NBSH29]|uniref:protein-L-isoaspartate O-methyltransferase family protein n=1 Tax=Mesorhizobium sp. NBSH29 TaxID=2654249 RepID=UPI00189689FE|nr:protein-L-isoaspartate O-methyltransferase [Mesorhizobium sp. NBSH29]QPC87546.1 methyltransferase domain-containing protein [Mesorhizobium sp. NBSH29]
MNASFSEMRVKMVDGQLRTTDVTDAAILDVMGNVPRESFVPQNLRDLAYIDEDLQVAPGRFIMEASPFAKLLQLADISSRDHVLDVGSATGYSAAVLAGLAASVTALESDSALADKARENLSSLSNVTIVTGSLAKGASAQAPFDVIVINGAVDVVPQPMFDQLAERGRLVVVVGHGNAAVARLYLKDDAVVTGRAAFNAAVKALPGFEKIAEFEF